MRRVARLVAILILTGASLATGQYGRGDYALPAVVATPPGDESAFNREFDDAVRARFANGSREKDLIAYLGNEKFEQEWRRRDAENSSSFVLEGLICKEVILAQWRADGAGLLTNLSGSYESPCL